MSVELFIYFQKGSTVHRRDSWKRTGMEVVEYRHGYKASVSRFNGTLSNTRLQIRMFKR